MSIEPTRSNEGFIERFGKVRGSDDDDTFALREPIQLNKELIQC